MAESSGSVNPPPPAQNSPPTGWSQDKLFVGRAREMAELRAALEDAYAGRGHLCLLAGEPGIGKTRTAEEFALYARQRAPRTSSLAVVTKGRARHHSGRGDRLSARTWRTLPRTY